MLALKPLNRPFLFALTGLLALSSLCQKPDTGYALPFHSKQKAADKAAAQLQTFQPPAVDSIRTRCEPYRLTVVQNNNRFLLAKPFFTPQSLYLMAKYNKCINSVMDQEYLYLKHAEIENPTKMPKMAIPLDLDSNNAAGSPDNQKQTTEQSPEAPSTEQLTPNAAIDSQNRTQPPNPAQMNSSAAPKEILQWKLFKPKSDEKSAEKQETPAK
jgi:hypothetical protein